MSKRAHISLKTKLASALLTLGHVDYGDAKGMTADQIISLYHWDHGILHAIEANDSFWNLTPVLIQAHREKSKRDTAIVAKSKRVRRKQDEHWRNMNFTQSTEEGSSVIRYRRKIPSRPFPTNKSKLRSHKRGN